MTFLSTRAACALTLALALGGCGGKAEFPVTVTVSGLYYDSLVLSNNGQNLVVKAAPANQFGNTTATFPNTISYGDAYEVTIGGQPPHSTCSLADPENNAKGTAGRLATINVIVTCGVASHALGGNVLNLTSTGLTIINGSNGGGVTVVPGATPTVTPTPFTLSPVQYDQPYGVSILTQPLFDTCKIDGGATGTMGDVDITNINLSCVRDSVAGNITGLSSAGMVLTNASTGATITVATDSNGLWPTVFTFGKTTPGAPYNVTITTQPASQNCTIANGSGTVQSTTPVMTVTCVAK